MTFVGRGMTEIWEKHKMGKRKALKLNFDSKGGLRSSFILRRRVRIAIDALVEQVITQLE